MQQKPELHVTTVTHEQPKCSFNSLQLTQTLNPFYVKHESVFHQENPIKERDLKKRLALEIFCMKFKLLDPLKKLCWQFEISFHSSLLPDVLVRPVFIITDCLVQFIHDIKSFNNFGEYSMHTIQVIKIIPQGNEKLKKFSKASVSLRRKG